MRQVIQMILDEPDQILILRPRRFQLKKQTLFQVTRRDAGRLKGLDQRKRLFRLVQPR